MHPTTQSKLISSIHKFTPQKILVLGDLMLDQYTWGNVNRISPEAPIPVIQVEKEEFRLGGAANTVANVRALDCEVYPIGLVGNDRFGDQLFQIFEDERIHQEGIVREDSFQTIVKNRVLTGQQQLIRIDHEKSFQITSEIEDEILKKVEMILPKVDGVILSDYQKGVLSPRILQETIKKAKERKLPIVCDPGRGVDFTHYRGVTTIKPNRVETSMITGIELNDKDSILKAAIELQKKCQADFLSMSLDKDGILFFKNENDYEFFPTEAQEVFDVTGAGDVVTTFLGVLLSAGEAPANAIQIANLAAGLEIKHVGVVPIVLDDLLKKLQRSSTNKKIVVLEELVQILETEKDKIIFTNGYFDNLSAGHLRFLLEMKRFHGKVVVAINSDRSIERDKGIKPLLSEEDRAKLLASLEDISWVVIFDHESASDIITKINPDVVVKGDSFRDTILPEQTAIQACNATLEYLERF
ncbi:MAG: D-beta-D-heptose 7-phosphate kinase/D-beta-D-heptose 1-phosphate adenosyltransferase [bacterium]|jgi:D-beta-D-heptose 7-phosphate kinase/D-beta-D-heptose 1-phosphate adenosyltransferase